MDHLEKTRREQRLIKIRMRCLCITESEPLSVRSHDCFQDARNLNRIAADDILVMKDAANPEWMWHPEVTLDGKYVVLSVKRDSSRVSTRSLCPGNA